MNFYERILQAVLFELGAILITTLSLEMLAAHDNQGALWVSIAISLIAMLWSFLFNLAFDWFVTGAREQRSWTVRIIHSLGFEMGLLFFTVPLIAYQQQINLWQALLADIGITLLILLYSVLFHWCYDHLRLFFYKKHNINNYQ